MSDDELEAQFVAEFKALAERKQNVCLEMKPLDAWIILSQLQLALRHPQNTGEAAQRARHIAHQLQAIVAPDGALAIVALRGWDSRYDEPRD